MTNNPVNADIGQLPVRPGRIRRHLARHPRRTDVTWAAVYAVPLLVTYVLQVSVSTTSGSVQSGPATISWDLGHERTPIWFLAMAVALAVAVTMTFAIATIRRSRPWLVFWIGMASCLVGWTILPGAEAIAPSLVLFGLAVYRSSSAAWRGMAIFGVAQVLMAVYWVTGESMAVRISNAVMMIVLNLAVTAISVNVGNQRRYLTALRERAEALERERDRSAQLAAAEERTRIAREMHDVVAHSLSVMVTLSDGAAAAVERSPDRAIAALTQLSMVGREATADMRRLLGVLRSEGPDDGASRLPQPSTGDLVDLCEQFRASGLPVQFAASGQVPPDPALQLAIYRIVQEALTNALRYAHRPTAVRVSVDGGQSAVEIRVSDNGTGQSAGPTGGHGLLGMGERVSAYGGQLVVGPRPEGGWMVAATLPLASDGSGGQAAWDAFGSGAPNTRGDET